MKNNSLHSFASKTDKSYAHQYIHVYEALLEPIRKNTKLVLEIGIWDGGSLLMWRDYFSNAKIFGIDINIDCNRLFSEDRITTIIGNAYQEQTVNDFKEYGKFDVIVDDGPHSLESQCYAAAHYSSLLSDNGILIIEDIPNPDWIAQIANVVPEELKPYCYGVDRRIAPNRHSVNDELMFVIDKRFV